jgi:hypothetical protein
MERSSEVSTMRKFIEFPAPNFSKITMDQVLELREESAWHDLRRAVTNIVSTVEDDIDMLNDPNGLEKTIEYEVNSAILNALEKSYPNGKDTVIDFAMFGASFLPLIGMIPDAISAGKSIYKYFDARDNWPAFILKLKKFH